METRAPSATRPAPAEAAPPAPPASAHSNRFRGPTTSRSRARPPVAPAPATAPETAPPRHLVLAGPARAAATESIRPTLPMAPEAPVAEKHLEIIPAAPTLARAVAEVAPETLPAGEVAPAAERPRDCHCRT